MADDEGDDEEEEEEDNELKEPAKAMINRANIFSVCLRIFSRGRRLS